MTLNQKIKLLNSSSLGYVNWHNMANDVRATGKAISKKCPHCGLYFFEKKKIIKG